MMRPVSTSFRRALLPALLLLLPVAASAFATSAAPAGMGIAPARVTDPPDVDFADEPDDLPGDELMKRTSKPSAAVKAGAVTVSVAPAPFLSVTVGDQIVREFIVRNDAAETADFTVVMRYNLGSYGEFSRSVTTSRKIPGHSVQTVPVFVPANLERYSSNISVINPLIYVNGRQIYQMPLGIFDAGEVDSEFYAMPSSFTTSEPVMKSLIKELCPVNKGYYRDIECGFSNSDTVQWPAIPQFYQAKGVLFRKTNDKFTPDAERAIREAVMLGATEFVFIPYGSQRPEWAPAPAEPGQPVVLPHGFGRTVVMDESQLYNPALRRMLYPNEDDEKRVSPRPRNEDAETEEASRNNRQKLDYLKSEHLFIINPAVLFQMLPCVEIPNMSFAIVILALLAYIVLVGPVNYFQLKKRKKSALMLLFTVPAISLVFVGIVILFVTFFEGWFSRASAVGVTFLDQNDSMGYTRAAVNLYAPLPIRRLVFDTADTVSFARAKDANISLGRDQVVTGANKARIPLVYGISRAEKHLEQLKVSRNAAGTLTVMNGLGAPVKILAMKTPDGACWLPPDGVVQPGVSAELKPFTGDAGTFHAGVFDQNTNAAFDLAPGRNQLFFTVSSYLAEGTDDDSAGNTARTRIRGDISSSVRSMFAMKNAFEKAQADGGLSPFSAVLSPGMYIAETDRPLFYTPGCSPVSFRARHLVVGTFTLQESAHEN